MQIGDIRNQADKLATAVELHPEEKVALTQWHSRKLVEHVKRSMIAILRDITAHRVRDLRLSSSSIILQALEILN